MNALMDWSDGNEKVDQAFQPQQALVCVQKSLSVTIHIAAINLSILFSKVPVESAASVK